MPECAKVKNPEDKVSEGGELLELYHQKIPCLTVFLIELSQRLGRAKNLALDVDEQTVLWFQVKGLFQHTDNDVTSHCGTQVVETLSGALVDIGSLARVQENWYVVSEVVVALVMLAQELCPLLKCLIGPSV